MTMSEMIIWKPVEELKESEQKLVLVNSDIPGTVRFFEDINPQNGMSSLRYFISFLFISSSMILAGMLVLNSGYYAVSTNVIVGGLSLLLICIGVFLLMKRKSKLEDRKYRAGFFLFPEFFIVSKADKVCRVPRNLVFEFRLKQVSGNTSNPEAGKYAIDAHWVYEGQHYSCHALNVPYGDDMDEHLAEWVKTGSLPISS